MGKWGDGVSVTGLRKRSEEGGNGGGVDNGYDYHLWGFMSQMDGYWGLCDYVICDEMDNEILQFTSRSLY